MSINLYNEVVERKVIFMKLNNLLNQQVANLITFFVKLHNYHWYIVGDKFFELHEKFEEIYDEVNELYDEVAERMLMLDMNPVATLKESLALTTIKEATGKENAKEMTQKILDDLVQLNDEFGQVLEAAEEVGDDITVDLFTAPRASFQKHIWMLKAYLK